MKTVEIDDDIYAFIAAHTEHIGESASDILRRLLGVEKAEPSAPAESEKNHSEPAARVFDVVTSGDLAAEKSAVARFLFILSMLYRCHREQFKAVLAIQVRDRMYFSTSEGALLASGNSTNPKQIPQSPYWVITNNNTTRKKSMLTAVARKLGYSSAEAERIRDFL